MSRRRIAAILEREWLEIRRNRIILATMALLPLFLIGLTLGTAFLMLETPVQEMKLDRFVPPAELAALGKKEAFIVLMNDQYLLYLLLIPMALPVTSAAYSIIGEKQARSLEPLLATPVTTFELLVGKTAAAVAPAVVLGWLSYGAVLLGLRLIAGPALFLQAARPIWLMAMFALSPMLSVLSALASVIVSSRVNDLRAAQSVAALVVIPVVAGGVTVIAGKIFLGPELVLTAAAVVALANAAALWVAVRLFRRETILTRWK